MMDENCDGNCMEMSVGFYARLLKGSTKGKLLARMVDWIYDLEDDKEREDIDMISGIMAESIAEMFGCEVDDFFCESDKGRFVTPAEEEPKEEDSDGYLELLANGNEGGKLIAQLVEWLHGLERFGGGWYRDDIDHFAGVIVDTLVDLLDCPPDIFVTPTEEDP